VVFVFGEGDCQGIGQLGAGFEDVGGPVEDFGEELDRIDRLVAFLPCQSGQLGLDLHRPLPVHEHALPDQHGGRNDQPDRANLAEPFAVGEEFWSCRSQGWQ